MKTLIVLIAIWFLAWLGPNDRQVSSTGLVPNEKVFASFIVDGVSLSLTDHDGRCKLLYSLANADKEAAQNEIDAGMSAPCNFIRRSPQIDDPVSHTFQKGKDRHTVLMVTGGTADPRFKDKFQPDGCGTWQARIQVFSDKVNISWSGENGPAWCPSSGMDDMMLY